MKRVLPLIIAAGLLTFSILTPYRGEAVHWSFVSGAVVSMWLFIFMINKGWTKYTLRQPVIDPVVLAPGEEAQS